MSRRGPCWVVCAALCSSVACTSEVVVHLLTNEGDAGGDSGSSDGQAGSGPCQKLGAEVCNGGDDDCNGVTDDGCGYTVVWARDPDGVPMGHAIGGVDFVAPCADGSVLTGLRVGMGTWLNQVVAVCRQIALGVDTTQSPVRFSATLGPRRDSSFAPAVSTDPKNKELDLLCPDGLVLAGVDGTTTTDEPRYILGIRITCAPPIVTAQAGGPVLDSDRTQAQTTGPVVCADCAATQAFNYTTAIAPGHVATRLFGGDGLWVDRVGFGSSVGTITAR